MIGKISLTAAFLLIAAPPMACASTRDAASRAPMTRPAQDSPRCTVVAQQDPSNVGATDNDNDNDNSSDNDNDSNDNGNDNQNADGSQMDQPQNDGGDEQVIPPTVLGAPDTDAGDGSQAPQQVNPYQ
jgi:hypothetical protein